MTSTKKLSTVLAIALLAVGAGAAGAAWAGGGDPSGEGAAPGGATRSVRLLGEGTSESKFVPITPCRLVDTRQGANTPMAPTQVRRFDVRGTGSTFAAQGGKSNGCAIPDSGVTAVEVTVTAILPTGTGFLRVYPEGEPTATFLNYTPTFNASNTGTVGVCGLDGGICIANQDLAVKNFSNTTDVVIDVQGYYARPMAATVDQDGTLDRNSRALAATRTDVGKYSVQFDRDVTSCAIVGTIGRPTPSGTLDGEIQTQYNAVQGDAVYVSTHNSAGTLEDLPFTILVTC